MNAKQEFLNHLEEVKARVKCANISSSKKPKESLLKVGYKESEWMDFINSLDFIYHEGYGGQELYGTIWYDNGTFSSRGEYDGSEWWEHYKTPEIPKKLL